MRFPFIKNIIYETALKKEEIIERLSEITEPEETVLENISKVPSTVLQALVNSFTFGLVKIKKDSIIAYKGRIDGQTFEIHTIPRIRSFRRSMIVQITGFIDEDYDRTIIYVKMGLPSSGIIFAGIFLTIWFGGIMFAFIATAIAMIVYGRLEYLINLIGISIMISLALMMIKSCISSLENEINKSKEDLQEIFEADIIEE